MTLPTSGSISSAQIMAELRVANPARAFPLSLTDADVLALAGKGAPPISIPTDLYGKSAYTPMSGSVPDTSDDAPIFASNNYFYDSPISVIVSGGQVPFSYAWTKVSGDSSATVTAANAANTNVRFNVNRFASPGTALSVVVQCVVTDGTGATMTRQGTANLILTE